MKNCQFSLNSNITHQSNFSYDVKQAGTELCQAELSAGYSLAISHIAYSEAAFYHLVGWIK